MKVTGTVRDAKSGERIARAIVRCGEQSTTDLNGCFVFPEVEDAIAALVEANAVGYYSATAMIKAGDAVNIALYPVEA